MKRITVLLADDHIIVREGIRKIMEMDAEFEVIGEARDDRQAVAMAFRRNPLKPAWRLISLRGSTQ